jgi:ABC-type nitrate/sulfonate/bicarbonate transport system substrate-binding protein
VRYVLKKYGLAPGKDVGIVQMSGGQPETLASIQSGRIAAGILSPPVTFKAASLGLHQLVDFTALKVPFIEGGIAVQASTLAARPAEVRAFLSALQEAVAYGVANEAPTEQIIAKYSKVSNPALLKETYDLFWGHVIKRGSLAIAPAALRAALAFAAEKSPPVAHLTGSDIYDPTVLPK